MVMQGRAIRLSDYARPLLHIIASRGPDGILQPELGRLAKVDQRAVHYHLSELIQYGVVAKVPVSSKKTATFLVLLSRWIEDETDLCASLPNMSGAGFSIRLPYGQLKRRLTEVLQSAPTSGRTMSVNDLIDIIPELDVSRPMLRYVRMAMQEMTHSGHVELILTRSLGGPSYFLYKFKRLYIVGENDEHRLPDDLQGRLEDSHESMEDSPDFISDTEEGTWAPLLVPFVALEKQARDLVAASGTRGIVIRDLKNGLGASTKFATRLYERLTTRKLVGNSDVVKVTESHGRERRHRLFIENPVDIDMGECKAKAVLTPELRQQIFLEIMREQADGVLVVSRPAIVEVGHRIAMVVNDQHTIDMKTVARLVESLEAAGQLRTVHVVLKNGATKVIACPPDLPASNPTLLEMIREMKGENKKPESSSSESEQEEVYSDDGPKVRHRQINYRQQLEIYGLVHGVMQKLRVMHFYLIETFGGGGGEFNTAEALFLQLPLGVFLKLVSTAVPTPELHAYIIDERNHGVRLDEMPGKLRAEIAKKRGLRLRQINKLLVGHMTDLGLITPVQDEDTLARYNLHLPPRFLLSSLLHATSPPDARSSSILPASTPAEADAYWQALRDAWCGCQTDDVDFGRIPVVYGKAVCLDEWAVKRHERVERIASALNIAGTARIPSKRRPIGIATILPKPTGNSSRQTIVGSRSRPKICLSDWSPDQTAKLHLILLLLLLQKNPAELHSTPLNWTQAEGLIAGRDAHVMRVTIGRVMGADWGTVQALLGMEKRVAFVRVRHMEEVGAVSGDFHALFALYERLMKTTPMSYDLQGSGPLVKVNALEPSRVLEYWQRSRHYRSAIQAHFESIPGFIPPTQDQTVPPSDVSEEALNAVKVVMTWPGASYSAIRAAALFKSIGEDALHRTVDHLMASGYLALSSQGRNRYRVPGTNYCLAARVTSTLLTSGDQPEVTLDGVLDGGMVQNIDIGMFVDSLITGAISSEVREGGEVVLHGHVHDRLPKEEVLQLIMQELGLWKRPLRSWFWPDWNNTMPSDSSASFFNAKLLRCAVRTIRTMIDEDPGISIDALYATCIPILTPVEIADILAILSHLRLIHQPTTSSDNIFPKL